MLPLLRLILLLLALLTPLFGHSQQNVREYFYDEMGSLKKNMSDDIPGYESMSVSEQLDYIKRDVFRPKMDSCEYEVVSYVIRPVLHLLKGDIDNLPRQLEKSRHQLDSVKVIGCDSIFIDPESIFMMNFILNFTEIEFCFQTKKCEVIPLLENIISIGDSTNNNQLVADLLYYLGREYRYEGEFKKSIEAFELAVSRCESADLRLDIPMVGYLCQGDEYLNEIAISQRILGDYVPALKNHDQALWYHTLVSKDTSSIIDTYVEKSKTLLKSDAVSEAKSVLDTALFLSSVYSGHPESVIYYEYGMYYTSIDSILLAKINFKNALDLTLNDDSKNEIYFASLLMTGFLQGKDGDINSAIDNLNTISKSGGLEYLNPRDIVLYYKTRSRVFEEVNRVESFGALKKAQELESRYNKKIDSQRRIYLADKEGEYQSVRKELEKIDQDQDRRDDLTGFIMLVLLFIGVLILILFSLRFIFRGIRDMFRELWSYYKSITVDDSSNTDLNVRETGDAVKGSQKKEGMINSKAVFTLKSGDKIPLQSIACIKKRRNVYVYYYYVNDNREWTSYYEKNSLSTVIKQLPENEFVRTEQSHIVNLAYCTGDRLKEARKEYVELTVDLSELDIEIGSRVPLRKKDKFIESFAMYRETHHETDEQDRTS